MDQREHNLVLFNQAVYFLNSLTYYTIRICVLIIHPNKCYLHEKIQASLNSTNNIHRSIMTYPFSKTLLFSAFLELWMRQIKGIFSDVYSLVNHTIWISLIWPNFPDIRALTFIEGTRSQIQSNVDYPDFSIILFVWSHFFMYINQVKMKILLQHLNRVQTIFFLAFEFRRFGLSLFLKMNQDLYDNSLLY